MHTAVAARKGTARIRQEARVLYTLLDSAQDAGLLVGLPIASTWDEIDDRVRVAGNYETEAEHFHAVMSEPDASGAMVGTWIEERWRAVQSRIGTHG